MPLDTPRVNILGVGISALNPENALTETLRFLETGERGYICVTGVHGIMESQRDEPLRTIQNRSFLTTPDGMPTVWLGRLFGFGHMRRVYGPDFMVDVCKHSVDRGYRHFLYGGKPGVAEDLRTELIRRFPGINIVGTYTPPFRPLNLEEEAELKMQLQQSKAQVLWCGLSTPKQERFMGAYIDRLPVNLMVGVGAAFDLLSGNLQEAPDWVKKSGLQWLFRLMMEPRRLWRRYLYNNPLFIWLTILQFTGIRRYRLTTG